MALSRTPGRAREAGQAVVELALVATVCLLLTLGVIDIARLYGTSEALTNAAHEGAKVAAEYYSNYSGNPSGLDSLVENQIVQEGILDPNSISNLQVTLQDPQTPDYPGEQIVQVSFKYKFSFFGPWRLIPGLTNPTTIGPFTSAEATH